jgi:hypothetical protein
VVIGFSHYAYLGIDYYQSCLRAHTSGSFSHLNTSFVCSKYNTKSGVPPGSIYLSSEAGRHSQ